MQSDHVWSRSVTTTTSNPLLTSQILLCRPQICFRFPWDWILSDICATKYCKLLHKPLSSAAAAADLRYVSDSHGTAFFQTSVPLNMASCCASHCHLLPPLQLILKAGFGCGESLHGWGSNEKTGHACWMKLKHVKLQIRPIGLDWISMSSSKSGV